MMRLKEIILKNKGLPFQRVFFVKVSQLDIIKITCNNVAAPGGRGALELPRRLSSSLSFFLSCLLATYPGIIWCTYVCIILKKNGERCHITGFAHAKMLLAELCRILHLLKH